MSQLLDDRVLEAVQRLVPIAEGAGLTMAQLALAWVLREPNVASAIVGASRPEQVHANASASGVTLDAHTLAAIDEAMGDRGRALSRTSFKIDGASGAFLDQAGRRGPPQPVLVARARRTVEIQRSVQGRLRACRSF